MKDVLINRLHRIDREIAQKLVDAGLEYPAQIRAASDGNLRKALKGKGVNERVAAVRRAYPKRK